ncbi:FAD binding domain-containing protein [Orrella dioscoreae]|uniref:Periplasmic aromatic aldehyde oxidoreductase, FAD binding subunit YagS n=1 Tax=Orrella dioscoreae TaxID=1851544 RepID=A0A1C3K7A5_9BURK|nr:xanthine dehydrogenase family protein subunit M [Orrella dioscoreae]SBT27352.1 Periplasmic aromatic aldehyde oxidoreductase, FAD binding subunit YagS [Orrella dioscoreae]SOE50067.1 Periplasmic aromatic aldehyde oxidoreductase, FAD binding subunit YagS [Orrella dioscoreae]
MQAFHLSHSRGVSDALRAAGRARAAGQSHAFRFLAGGTTLLDLMKLEVETPLEILDISRLPLTDITERPDGGLDIGAMVRNADLAHHPAILAAYPVLSQALLAGASPQLRNMATTGGNLMQRTRCVYFRDTATACNKREPGSGCSAIEGYHRNMAVLGTSEHCVAAHPSDMAVALVALDATVVLESERGARRLPVSDFFLLPGSTPQHEHALAQDELITGIRLPPPVLQGRSVYLKLRDRASYEFALASAGVVLAQRAGVLKHVRIALGGVGAKPWRSPEAEAVLLDRAPTESLIRTAAEAALRDARPLPENAFKVELAKRCLMHALSRAVAEGRGVRP